MNSNQCPICQQNNQCGNNGDKPCWCSKKSFPEHIFEMIPEDKLHKACICRECLKKYAQ
ncbi:cysteine-rich CWC family protein [Pontibacillus litoralis]|uniref:Cysteine-rich CWC protein n=1 Tax=Pontibacillus litoralis JSM 072002 TaxID=1385512 RepID=A0A0A5G1Q3_9BACI|nr:cysteine-rich CWC family protein [Pontibacillus litoralis]KGX87006.1 hypothetical protein N784_02470 [Pontibacillus litoralis JSM 072002]